MDKAWEYFFEGKIVEAKQLIEEDYRVETCLEYAVLNLFAYIYLDEQNFEKALLACQRYIQLSRDEKDVEQEHIGLHQLAMVYRSQGNFKKALELIEEEVTLLETDFSEDKLKWSVNEYEQGYLRLQLGELESAQHFMKRSLENALMTDDLIAQACAYRGLGEIYATKGVADLAEQAFTQSITAFEKASDTFGVEEVRELMATYQII
ncbi:TPA: tetratricopeptide repeat protein [Streptococcus suis]|nr:tetratricopeptide repeat protein [Streptococcus suis]HEM2768304.1 tetratricopeptide repeat protein [Streptococcus suis]HEM5154522.1 tetratricopeptide repeat protein [Streptococcus suis]HEM5182137.1 tetratricopeptide repeat protein [Streptococcus suis]HEM6015883.1 tetratricopeptide repeat protein [Streptococcus suis]